MGRCAGNDNSLHTTYYKEDIFMNGPKMALGSLQEIIDPFFESAQIPALRVPLGLALVGEGIFC